MSSFDSLAQPVSLDQAAPGQMIVRFNPNQYKSTQVIVVQERNVTQVDAETTFLSAWVTSSQGHKYHLKYQPLVIDLWTS